MSVTPTTNSSKIAIGGATNSPTTDFIARAQHVLHLAEQDLSALNFLGLHATTAQGLLALLQTGFLPTINSNGHLYFYADPNQVRSGALPPHHEEPQPPENRADVISLTSDYATVCAREYALLAWLGLPLSIRSSVAVFLPQHSSEWRIDNSDVAPFIRAGICYSDYARAYRRAESDCGGFIVALSPTVVSECKVLTASEIARQPDEGYALAAPAGVNLDYILGIRAMGAFERMILDQIRLGEDIIAPITTGASGGKAAKN